MNTQTVIEGVTPPPAPKRTVAMVKEAVLSYIKRHDLQWGDPEQAADDIANEWHWGMDGYQLAKDLDTGCGWDISAQDVEDLDNIHSVVRDAEEKARKAWAAEWDIKPPLPIGTHITRGEITGISEYMAACYEVKEPGCSVAGRYLLVKFEEAKAKEAA